MFSVQDKSESFSYYHREYRNDADLLQAGSDWLSLAERVGMAALPFVALNKSLSFPISLGMGALRTWTTASQCAELYSRGGEAKEVGYHFLQTAIAAASLAGTLFAHPLGMLMTTVHDLGIESCYLIAYLQAGEKEKALASSVAILNNALYLATMCSGAPELLVASLALQVIASLHQSQAEFREGRWIEASSHMLMSLVRGKQLRDAIEALDLRYKIQAFQKQHEEQECKIVSAKLQQGGMPDGYSKESIRLELESLGFDVFKIANNGNTVLHQAAIKGNLRAVELSLAYGFDISRQNKAGDTALHLAAARGSLDIVQYLVQNKADWKIKNNLDQLAFHKGLKHKSIVDYFVSLGYIREHSMHEYATAKGLRPDYVDRQGNTFYHRLVLSNNLPLLEEAIKSKFRLDLLEKTNHDNLRVFGLCGSLKSLPALQIFFDQFGKGYGNLNDLAKAAHQHWIEGLEAMIPFCRPTGVHFPDRAWTELSIAEVEEVRRYLVSSTGWFAYPGGPEPTKVVRFLKEYDFQALTRG